MLPRRDVGRGQNAGGFVAEWTLISDHVSLMDLARTVLIEHFGCCAEFERWTVALSRVNFEEKALQVD